MPTFLSQPDGRKGCIDFHRRVPKHLERALVCESWQLQHISVHTCTLPTGTCILHPYCIHTVDITSRSPSHRHALFRPHLHLRLPYPSLLRAVPPSPSAGTTSEATNPKPTSLHARIGTAHLLGGTFLRHTIHVPPSPTSYLLPPNRSSLLRRVAIIGFDLCSPSLCTTRARVTTWPPGIMSTTVDGDPPVETPP